LGSLLLGTSLDSSLGNPRKKLVIEVWSWERVVYLLSGLVRLDDGLDDTDSNLEDVRKAFK
tara:strand:- start:298 stop:480 length:183 start_codon:yes stop_codon:yes gene_type:complete